MSLWNINSKGRANIYHAGEFQGGTQIFQMLFSNIQANSRTLGQHGILCPEISFKNVFLIFFRDTDPLVYNLQLNLVITLFYYHIYSGVFGTILYRIPDQIG
jgi:hypothetical protein